MKKAEDIKADIEKKFIAYKDAVTIQSERRMWLDIPLDNFILTLEYLRNELGFTLMSTMTGFDEGEKISIIYHLVLKDNTIMFNLRTRVLKDKQKIKSVIGYYRYAELYEREIADLLGVEFEGLPAGRNYPLPEGWPKGQHPLRKDWNASMLDAVKE